MKAPSAELRPDQRDDQSLPPYEQLDPLLELYVEGDATAEELIAARSRPCARAQDRPAGRPQRVQASPDAPRGAHLEEGVRSRPAHAHHQRVSPGVDDDDSTRVARHTSSSCFDAVYRVLGEAAPTLRR